MDIVECEVLRREKKLRLVCDLWENNSGGKGQQKRVEENQLKEDSQLKEGNQL